MRKTPRMVAILNELEKAAREYSDAKCQYDQAHVQWESAKQRFGVVRNHASQILTPSDWMQWRTEHPRAQYVGIAMGDAIVEMLTQHAYESAIDAKDNDRPFKPEMTIHEIVNALEEGGFEFKGTTPLREVNAALIHLNGVMKRQAGYAAEDADQILEEVSKWPDQDGDQK